MRHQLKTTFLVSLLLMSPATAAPLVAARGNVSVIARDGGFLWGSGNGFQQETNYAPASALMKDRSWKVLKSTLGIDSDGALWSWGSEELGVETPNMSFYPIRVGTDSNWRSISPGSGYSFAIKDNGTLWGWGNYYVNNLTLFFSRTPVRFGSDSNWRFVTGSGYQLAIQNDGSLWAWGHNGHGNLGDGTFEPRTVPVRVGTDNDWATAANVGWTSFGIKTDGSLWVWGATYGGTYGDGGFAPSSSIPVRVGTDNDWQKISGSDSAVLAIRTDGSLWSWGQSSDGMLGLGAVTSQWVPARIGSENTWSDLAAGDSHVIAARTDGSLWAWGRNNYVQFGSEGTTSSNVPINVSAGFTPRPRFVVYRDNQKVTRNLDYWNLKTAIHQEPTSLEVVVRNDGFAPLTLSAGSLPGFTVIPPAEIAGLSDAVVQVRMEATTAGSFSGQVDLNSNDPDRTLFSLSLSGDVVSSADDWDQDGMNDAAEVALEALGFRWNSAQDSLVAEFYANVGHAGLHHQEEILDVKWQPAAPAMDPSGALVQIPLALQNPVNPAERLLLPGNIRQAPAESLDVSVPLPAGKRFLRLEQP